MQRNHINVLMTGAAMLLSLTVSSTPSLASSDDTNLMLIFDASGSMKKKLESGQSRIDAAKAAMDRVLGNVEEGVNLGLTMYGHRVKGQCTDIELVSPIGSEDTRGINAIVQNVTAKGETPIADSINKAAKSFKAFKGADNRIVLVTDGIEECGGNVCEAAQAAKDMGVDLKIDVVGFTLNSEQRSAVSCISDITGGKYYDAADAEGLGESLKKVVKKSSDDVKDEPAVVVLGDSYNLIASANGGTLISAPDPEWAKLTDGSEAFADENKFGPGYKYAGVWSFKDGKTAIFDRLEWYVEGSNIRNLTSAEVAVNDSADITSFTPIGLCFFDDTRMMQSPYQACTFPKTSAKYVMIRMLGAVNAPYSLAANEMRLFGSLEGEKPTTLADSAAPSPNPALPAALITSYKNPEWKGKALDICLSWGTDCGEPVATSFCQKQGHKTGYAWTERKNAGETMIMSDDKICTGAQCTTFAAIQCRD